MYYYKVVSFFVVVGVNNKNVSSQKGLSLSFSFSFKSSSQMAAVSSSSSSSSPVSSLSSTSNARRRHGTATQPFFVLSLLFLLGGLFVLVKVRTTSDAFCEDDMSNRLESEREEEGDDRDMFFASSNGKERLEEEVVEAMMTTSSTGDANEAGRSAARDERGEKDYDDDDDESLKDTTTKILAETEEEETGSTGNRHNNTASTKKRGKRGPSGCTPNRVREFTAEALKNPKGGDTSETTSKVWLDAFGEDVSKRYNFTTCAVVGNSGSLLRPPRLNNDIDEHEVVIRLNAAPTSGRYGQRVGRKTTLRFLNAARAKTYLVGGCSKTMPCDEGSTLVATRGMPFAPSKVITNAHLSIVRGRRLDFGEEDFEDEENLHRQKRKAAMESQVLKMSEPERERLSVAQPPSNSMGAVKRVIKAYKSAYIEKCGEDDAKRLFKGPETPSTGFMAVIFALHMCSETVSVYGFKKQLKPYQYFRMRVKPSEVHDFTVEAEILTAMAKDGVLRMPGIVQDRVRGGGKKGEGIITTSSDIGSINSGDSVGSNSNSSNGGTSSEKEGSNTENGNVDEWFDEFISSSSNSK